MSREELEMIGKIAKLLGKTEFQVMKTSFVDLMAMMILELEEKQNKIDTVLTYLDGYKK